MEVSGCYTRFICACLTSSLKSTDQRALGQHTDLSSLTVLFNRLGGLQVQLPESEDWVYGRPEGGSEEVGGWGKEGTGKEGEEDGGVSSEE